MTEWKTRQEGLQNSSFERKKEQYQPYSEVPLKKLLLGASPGSVPTGFFDKNVWLMFYQKEKSGPKYIRTAINVTSPGIEPGSWVPETHVLSIVLRGH